MEFKTAKIVACSPKPNYCVWIPTLYWGNEIDLDPYVLREKIERKQKL